MTETTFLESIKLKDGLYHNLNLHNQRVKETIKTYFGLRPVFDLSDVLPTNVPPIGLFKVRLIYTHEPLSITISPYVAKKIHTMKLIEANKLDYHHKFSDRSALDLLKAKSGSDDIIIVQNGLITDSSIANLVLENDHGLFTPAKCLLAGVKRTRLLASGLIQVKNIRIDELTQYRRVRLINAMIDLEDEIGVMTSDIVGLPGAIPMSIPKNY
jgi:4-amino-4-deoxychorismate lyase